MLSDANSLEDSYSQTQLALRLFKIEGLKKKSVFFFFGLYLFSANKNALCHKVENHLQPYVMAVGFGGD